MDKVIRMAVLIGHLVLALSGNGSFHDEAEHHPEDRKACARVAR